MVSTLFAITLILLIIFITNQFVRELGDAALGKITLQTVMKIMSLQVPLLLGYLLPLGFFLGVLLTLGRLSVDHEMAVMFASGMSRLYVITRVLILSLGVAGIVGWVMLYVEPKIQEYRVNILTEAIVSDSIKKILPDRFQQFPGGNVFYAGSVSPDRKKISDVFFVKLPTQKDANWEIVTAKQTSAVNQGPEHFILFESGQRYLGIPGKANFNVATFSHYGVRSSPGVESLSHRMEALSSQNLWHLRKQSPQAAAELQWRLAMPISVFTFALLAIPLSQGNPKKGKFAQLVPAILLYLVYANFMFVGKKWIETGVVSPQVGLWWIHGSLLGLALLLLLMQTFGKYRWVFI